MSAENGLKSRIQADINDAMRVGDELLKSTLRMALTAIMIAEVAETEAVVLSDDQIINLLRSEMKKRAESADVYEETGLADSAAKERKEMAIIEKYLPAAMDTNALVAIVAEEVANAAANSQTGPKAMGGVIKAVKDRMGASADGSAIASAVKAALNISILSPPKEARKETVAAASNEIAAHLGVKIWKTVSGNFRFVTVGSDRWLFKVDPSTDSAIETGIRSLGLPSFQGRCTWGSKHVSEGIYEPVLVACFGNKNKALVVILHWNDFWKHDAAVNALSAHLKVSATPNITFMPSIMLWDGKTGSQQMGYRFGFSINPSFGMMPLTNALEGIRAANKPAVTKSHPNADIGMIRVGQFRPDFFSSNSEGGWFNE